jgi:zona occludens toxin (predicted ATPase)
MAIICYSGLPGTGKTASCTYRAVKKYRHDNNIIARYVRFIVLFITGTGKSSFIERLKQVKQQSKVNLIYSNYPIRLDKKGKVYSNIIKPSDLQMKFQLPHGALIELDEMQRYQDSREFKTFPKELGTFFQHHRHASIEDIILVTQHPRRLDNKMRDLCEVFRKYRIFIKLPFIPVIFTYYTNYYEFESYGMYNHVKKEARTYDYDNHFQFMFTWNAFTRYDSKYFKVIFQALPYIPLKLFTSKSLSLKELSAIGID